MPTTSTHHRSHLRLSNSSGEKYAAQGSYHHIRYNCKAPVHIPVLLKSMYTVIQMAVESKEGDIDLLNDETFGDGAVGEW